MGWLWGSSSGDQQSPSDKDPLRNLDPELREFLAKESPVKYSSSNPPAPEQKPSSSSAKSVPKSASQTPQPAPEQGPKVPEESLFKDGRYAHIWSTYQSQKEVESAAKSDAEKVNDVLEGYKYRKAEIGRAALENCALEQWDVNECFRTGAWSSRVTLCREENKTLERCYTMQAKFLKALGYLNAFNQPETDERIQMHADTLYHRMLDQEAAIEAAKAEGKPIPDFQPLLSSKAEKVSTGPAQAVAAPSSVEPPPVSLQASDLPESLRKQLDKRLEGLDKKTRDIEERAFIAELKAGEQVAGNLGKIYEKHDEERRIRKERGKETVGDKVSSIFGTR